MTSQSQAAQSSYTVEQLRPEQFDLLLPIMRDAFGRTVDVGYFRWKFLENPAGNVLGFMARASDGEVGAYYGVIPERYVIDGQERTIYQSCDTMTHSQHRRRGLFQMLALHCYQALRDRGELFVIGFGGGQSTPGFLKFGWKHIFDMRPYGLPASLCRFKRIRRAPHAVAVRSVTEPESIAELIQRTDQTVPIHLAKDLRFLKWRLANPRRRYRFLVSESSRGASGYAIVYDDGGNLFLLDFNAAGDPASERALILEICQIVSKERLRGVLTIAQERTPYGEAVRRAGLFTNRTRWGPLREGVPFIIFADDGTMRRFSESHNWNVTPLDHDAL